MLRKKIDGFVLLDLRNISLQTMDRRIQGGRAAGGGRGPCIPALAFVCQLCSMGFKHRDELEVHQLTEHASDADLVDDDTQPGAPSSFVKNSMYGPRESDFTKYDQNKIAQMLNERIGGPESIRKPTIPPPLFPSNSEFFGHFRGLEGRLNSCYLDVIFMMFAFSTAFDGIFTQKALNESIFLRIVLFEIVIPLRTSMFVNRDIVAMLRTFLADATQNQEYLTNTFDMTEFLMNLMEQIDFGMVCNFQSESTTCRLVVSVKGIEGSRLNLQELILHTMQVDGISFPKQPTAFFARVRSAFDLPPNCLPQSRVTLGRLIYLISAIFCIERSHYTAFYRLPDGEWVFFDCMRDKEHGHSIPSITHVPYFQAYLDSGCSKRLLSVKSDARSGETRNSFHDCVTRYAYVFVFTKDLVVLPSSSQSVPVLPPRLPMSTVSDARKVVPISQKSSADGGAAAVSAPATPLCRKPSAGGGAAAIPHQPPPSFGHAQRQVVAGPQSWKDKLQGFFPSLVICHLVKNILMPSAEYAPSDEDVRKRAILLSSIAFAAKKKWEAVSSAFLFWAPNITFDEFKTVHSVVASFQIGAQAFRCTAVVFNDEHVVASPELKNLNKSNTDREPKRKEFYREIELYFQENPRVVIDKMLLEPCV